VTAGSTGTDNTKIRTPQAVTNGNIAAGGIAHKLGNTERRNLSRAFLQKPYVLPFNLLDTAYACSYNGTGAKSILLREIKPAIIDRLDRRSHRKLRKPIHSLAFPPLDVFGYIEIFYLAAELYRVSGSVKGFD
jgi:hypothetical protein